MAKRPAPATYEFGDWLIEPQLNRLSHGERHVHLTPRAMDVLTFLLDRPGTVASIDELIDEVWQGRVVEENTVHRQVARIRQALSDDIHAPSYVETVPRRGYRTIAPVRRHEENGATEGAAVSTFLLEPFQSNEAGSILAVDVARGITADLRGWGWQTAADATAALP